MAASTLQVQRDFEIGARGMNVGPRDLVKSNSMRHSHDMPKYGVWSKTNTVLWFDGYIFSYKVICT